MGVKKIFTKKEAREICRRLGLAETTLSNDTCIIAQNDKGHIFKFPLGVPGEVEVINKPAPVEAKPEEPAPEKPVKRKRGRPPKKKKVEEAE